MGEGLNTTTVSLASAASGMVGGIATLTCLVFAHYGWNIPGEGSAALVAILTPIIHWAFVKFGNDAPKPPGSAPKPPANINVIPKANT